MRRALLAVVAFASLAGCRTVARQMFVEPTVSLRDVRIVGLGVSGGELDVQLNVFNPNQYRLDATKFTYRVFVGDTLNIAGGSIDGRTSVQAGDSTVVRIPVQFTYAGVNAAARQFFLTGAVTYRVAGEVVVWTGVGNVTVPFSTNGRYTTLRR